MFSKSAYLLTSDIQEIYRQIKNSNQGMTAFINDAKKVGTKENGYYLYKDEEALFKVFQKHLSKELTGLGIDKFWRLMQYIS